MIKNFAWQAGEESVAFNSEISSRGRCRFSSSFLTFLACAAEQPYGSESAGASVPLGGHVGVPIFYG